MACVSSVNWRADTACDESKGTTWGVAQALGLQVGGAVRETSWEIWEPEGKTLTPLNHLLQMCLSSFCRKAYQIVSKNKDFGGRHTRVQVSLFSLVACVALAKLLNPLTLD